jgi:hypothetical protein
VESIHPEQRDFSSGNIIYYIDYFLGLSSTMPLFYDLATAISLFGVIVVAIYFVHRVKNKTKKQKGQAILLSSALVLATLLLMSKKSYANYLAFAYFPLIYVLYDQLSKRNFWIACSLLSLVGSVQASLWFAQGGKGYWLSEWAAAVGWSPVMRTMLVEFTLMAVYGLIVWCSLRGLRRLNPPQPGR